MIKFVVILIVYAIMYNNLCYLSFLFDSRYVDSLYVYQTETGGETVSEEGGGGGRNFIVSKHFHSHGENFQTRNYAENTVLHSAAQCCTVLQKGKNVGQKLKSHGVKIEIMKCITFQR